MQLLVLCHVLIRSEIWTVDFIRFIRAKAHSGDRDNERGEARECAAYDDESENAHHLVIALEFLFIVLLLQIEIYF